MVFFAAYTYRVPAPLGGLAATWVNMPQYGLNRSPNCAGSHPGFRKYIMLKATVYFDTLLNPTIFIQSLGICCIKA